MRITYVTEDGQHLAAYHRTYIPPSIGSRVHLPANTPQKPQNALWRVVLIDWYPNATGADEAVLTVTPEPNWRDAVAPLPKVTAAEPQKPTARLVVTNILQGPTMGTQYYDVDLHMQDGHGSFETLLHHRVTGEGLVGLAIRYKAAITYEGPRTYKEVYGG